jgi:Zn2+/Cd2+-exporting ATPase
MADGNTTQQARYKVGGMDCASCATKIDTAVRRIPGVEDVSVSVAAGTMTVSHDEHVDLAAMEKMVSGLGYSLRALGRRGQGAAGLPPSALPGISPTGGEIGRLHDHREHGPDCNHTHDGGHEHAHHHGVGHDHSAHAENEVEGLHGHDHGPMDGPWWASKKGRLTILVGLALAVAYGLGHLIPAYETYIFTAAMLIGLVPIARRAIMAAFAGTPFSIEMLMTIAAVGAVIINASEEAAAVVFLFLVGELLEGVAAGKARSSIQSLTALVPKTALVEENGKTREVQAESLTVGAIILARPGDRISADGIITAGESAIDEAPVTGESTPVSKGEGEQVFAGTITTVLALPIGLYTTATGT